MKDMFSYDKFKVYLIININPPNNMKTSKKVRKNPFITAPAEIGGPTS